MKNKFIYSPTKSLFEKKLAAGEIGEGSVVFIEDTKEIWNRGHYFGMVDSGSSIDPEVLSGIETAIATLKSDKADKSELSDYALKSELPSLDGYLTKTVADSLYATIAQYNDLNQTVGDIQTELSNKATKDELSTGLAGKLDNSAADGFVPKTRKVNGKALDQDITITATDPNAATKDELGNVNTDLQTFKNNVALTYATDQDVADAVAALVDSSPAALDTLNELAAALGDDPNFATTVATQIGKKADQTALNATNASVANVDAKFDNYLPLSGGTISGTVAISGNSITNAPLNIVTPSMGYTGYIRFGAGFDTNELGYLGFSAKGVPAIKYGEVVNTLIHSGNYSDYALRLSGNQYYRFADSTGNTGLLTQDTSQNNTWYIVGKTNDYNVLLHSGNIGSYAFVPKSDSLISNVNADHYWSNGVYLNQTGNGSGNSNFPSDYSAFLTFSQSSNYAAQISIGSNAIHMRRKIDSWSHWMRIIAENENGNVLIGTTTDLGYKLDVSGNARITNSLELGAGRLDKYTLHSQVSGVKLIDKDNVERLGLYSYNKACFIENMYGGVENCGIQFFDSGTIGFFGGNVGIGITDPQYKLDLNGAFNATSGSINGNAIIHAGNIGSQSVNYANSAGSANSVAWDNVSGKPTFATVATSGSYNDLSNKPTIPTNTNQLTNGAGFITSYTDTKNTAGSTNSTSKLYLIGAGSQAANAVTYSNSSCYMQSGYLYATSDERLKNFENDITIDFNSLKSIPKKYFRWKENPENLNIGTSAQALQKVYPELVTTDENGEMGVNYQHLSIVALAAIDKLHEENLELKERIERLESKIK